MPPEDEEILSFRSQICCFRIFCNFCLFGSILFNFIFFGQNFLLAEIREMAEKDIA